MFSSGIPSSVAMGFKMIFVEHILEMEKRKVETFSLRLSFDEILQTRDRQSCSFHAASSQVPRFQARAYITESN